MVSELKRAKWMILLALLSAACAPQYDISAEGPTGISQETDFLIRELIVRNVLAELDEPLVFLAFKNAGKRADPPPSFMDRFVEDEALFVPQSLYSREEYPGQDPPLITVGIHRWRSDKEVEVSVELSRLESLTREGYLTVVKWVDGDWVALKPYATTTDDSLQPSY